MRQPHRLNTDPCDTEDMTRTTDLFQRDVGAAIAAPEKRSPSVTPQLSSLTRTSPCYSSRLLRSAHNRAQWQRNHQR